MPPCLLVVGAAVRDLDPSGPAGWRLGGGVCYGALTAARLGLRVRALIGVDPEAATSPELELLGKAGVELELVRLARGPVMENLEQPGGRLQFVQQASDPLPVAAVSSALAGSRAVLLAPVAGELGPAWADRFPAALVGLAWQGLLRRLEAGRAIERLPLRPHPLIARADLAVVSREDALAGGSELRELLSRDGQRLVVTHAVRGGLHLERGGETLRGRLVPSLPGRNELAPTGAGDVFLAAWLAATLCLARQAGAVERWRALAVASCAAGLSVEAAGLASVPSLAALARELTHRANRLPL